MRQLWAPWRMVYVGAGEETGEPRDCFLCLAGGDAEGGGSLVVDSSELTVTLLNRFPYSSGHLLVSPRRHVPDLTGLSDEEGRGLVAAAQRAVRALRSAMAPDGFNVGLNLGEAAGASVEHIHLHVVPRWDGDTNFMPVLGDVKVLPEHLQATARALREVFPSLATG